MGNNNPLLANVVGAIEDQQVRAKDREKVRVFQEIAASDTTSRKRVAKELSIRPNSVTTIVQQLIEDGLVVERERIDAAGPGRPEVQLELRQSRLTALSLYVESRGIVGAVVDLREHALVADRVPISEHAGNEEVIEAVVELVERLSARVPSDSEVLGMALAVTGVIDSDAAVWRHTARWPGIRDLPATDIQHRVAMRVLLLRILDAELDYLLQTRPDVRRKRACLIHWGYGIGTACAWRGAVLGAEAGRFGELGHMRFDVDSQKLCQCGQYGCLETEAALWALIPSLQRVYPQLPSLSEGVIDESQVSQLFEDDSILRVPEIDYAVDMMSIAIVNLYRMFFPDHLFIMGPFTSNSTVVRRITERLQVSLDSDRGSTADMSVLPHGFGGCLYASTYPFFKSRLRELLTIR